MNSHYANHFQYALDTKQQKNIKEHAKKVVFSLKKFNPNGKKLLDIGSGYGFLLQEAATLGIEAYGIEPSKTLFKFSKAQLKQTVDNLSLDQFLEINKKKYDFITLVHTIEHMHNPKKAIESATQMLNKEGILFIETPNLCSNLFASEKMNYTFLTPPDHIWIFSKKSFSYLLPTTTLRALQISTYSYPEHFMGIIKNLLKKKNKANIKIPLERDKKDDINIIRKKISKFKILFFDKFISNICYHCLNFFDKGSISQFYYQKK